jgi:L-asparaginase
VTVVLVATGGTIASLPGADGGARVALDGAAVLARAAAVGAPTDDVEVIDVHRGPTWSLDIDDRAAIAAAVLAAAARAEVDGVVVTHGTDTVEETLFLVWLLGGGTAHGGVPVVGTCAMRHAAHPEPDGPVNLHDALLIVRRPAAAGAGVLLVADGTVHHARHLVKTHATAVATFRSPGGPATATADGDDALPRAVAPPPVAAGLEPVREVAVVAAHGGLGPGVVAFLLDRGCRGLVVEGTGAGNVNAALLPGIERAVATNVPVVVTTRCLAGAVGPHYGGPGGGAELATLGVIPGGDLSSAKARLLLAVALAADPSPDAVAAHVAAVVETTGAARGAR